MNWIVGVFLDQSKFSLITLDQTAILAPLLFWETLALANYMHGLALGNARGNVGLLLLEVPMD